MKISFWLDSLFSHSGRRIRRDWRSCRHRTTLRRDLQRHGNQLLPAWVEILETRILLAFDFSDAPLPYPTTLADSSETLTTAPTLEVSGAMFFAPLSLNDAADFEEEIEEVVIVEIDFEEEQIEETNFQKEINETDFEDEELDDVFHSVDWLDSLNDGF